MSKWEKVKLEAGFSLIRNGASIKQGIIDGGYPITRIETIANSEVDRNKMGYAGITNISKYSSYILQTGDILMSHINSEKHLGKTAYYQQKQDELIIHGMNLLCLRPRAKFINYKYAYYFFQSNAFKKQIPNITKKSVNQASFTVTALKELMLPLPPLAIQKQIAKNLDIPADLLAMRKQQLAELGNLIKSTFYDMFGDPVENPKGWDRCLLSDLAEIIMGQSPNGNSYNDKGEGIPLLNGPTEFGSKYPVEKQWTLEPTKMCKKDDILFCVRGATAGRMNISDKEYCIGRGLAAIRPKQSNIQSFLYLYLSMMYDYFQATSNGSTFINISKDRLCNLPFLKVDSDIQHEFSKIALTIEEQKALVQKAINETQYLFDSLMSEYFE